LLLLGLDVSACPQAETSKGYVTLVAFGLRTSRKTGLLLLLGLLLLPIVVQAGQPSSALDYFLRGQELAGKKNYKEAAQAYKQAVSEEPDNAYYQYELGRMYAKDGQTEAALSQFQTVLRLEPENGFARTWLQILSQTPLAPKKKVAKPLSPLEQKARAEAEQMLQQLKGSGGGLKFQLKRLVIDAGHGGFDSGAVGLNGLQEKEVTLDIARRLKKLVEEKTQVKAFLSRTGDYYLPLSARTVIANQYRADLFVSIHINANVKRSAGGMETFFCSEKASSKEAARIAARENAVGKDEEFFKPKDFVDIEEILFQFERKLYWEDSAHFARLFQENLKQNIALRNRGVHSANFYVLRRAKMPAILLELGFISNPEEEARLRDPEFRQQLSEAVFASLLRYQAVAQQAMR